MIRRDATVVALLVGVVLVGGAIAGPVGAADNPGLINFEPREVEASPGDQFSVDVLLRANADYDDDGVVRFNYTIAFDPEVLSATDVTIGPWMEQGENTNVEVDTEIDEEAGLVYVEQVRDPPAGGVEDHGDTPTATITFAVPENAPPADAIIAPAEANAHLTEYPLPILTTREVTVAIDGGGEERRHPDIVEEDDEGPGVNLADDSSEEPVDEDPLPIPAVGAVALMAVAAASLFAYKRR